MRTTLTRDDKLDKIQEYYDLEKDRRRDRYNKKATHRKEDSARRKLKADSKSFEKHMKNNLSKLSYDDYDDLDI
jgi:hypothetical protein